MIRRAWPLALACCSPPAGPTSADAATTSAAATSASSAPATPAAPPRCGLAPPDRAACRRPWTLLVYMAADAHDLGELARVDLGELAAAFGPAAAEQIDVVVQLDVDAPAGLERLALAGPVEPAARTPLGAPAALLAALPEDEGPPAAALQRFVAWALRGYPSDRVALALWGHGQGWRPADAPAGPVRYEADATFGGFGFDASQNSVIDTPGLARALAGALAEARPDARLDLLALDACLMSTVEVAAALAPSARFLVGHEQVGPYAGFPYGHVLSTILEPPPTPACAAADLTCRAAAALPGLLARPESAAGADYVAAALIADALPRDLVPALERVGEALADYLAEDPLRAAGILPRLHTRRPGEGVPSFQGNTVDLGVLLLRLADEAALEAARSDPPSPAIEPLLARIDAARAVLAGAVLDVAVGQAYRDDEAYEGTPGPSGLSLWLPPDAATFRARRAAFASSPLHDPPGPDPWLAWMDRLYAAE